MKSKVSMISISRIHATKEIWVTIWRNDDTINDYRRVSVKRANQLSVIAAKHPQTYLAETKFGKYYTSAWYHLDRSAK
jgi:hypothetical protein